jgi:hypothetical protein
MNVPVTHPIAEHLPGEPRRDTPSGVSFGVRLLGFCLSVALLQAILAPLWLPFLLSVLRWGWPPNVATLDELRRYLGHTWRPISLPDADGRRYPLPEEERPPLRLRLWISCKLARQWATVPFWGLCWQMDELLYGATLDATPIVQPLIEISAARSGSTQLARYLEEDSRLCAPNGFQFMFPYRWLWGPFRATLGRILSPERIEHLFAATVPPEFHERHEGNPLRTDTFEAGFYLGHFIHLSPFLGPQILEREFGFASTDPAVVAMWEGPFTAWLDRIARKTLHLAADPRRRFFVKGHFIRAAPALERLYPDARFLTMVRDPLPCLQSSVNFMRANWLDATLGPAPWRWVGPSVAAMHLEYHRAEQAWLDHPGPSARCVLRFGDYVADLPGTLSLVYRECLQEQAPELPATHPHRKRSDYQLNRNLAQAGIDEAKFLASFHQIPAIQRRSGGAGGGIAGSPAGTKRAPA